MVGQEEIFLVAAGHIMMLVVMSTTKVVEDKDQMLGLTQEEVLIDSMKCRPHHLNICHVLNIVAVTHLVSFLSSII